MSIPQSGKHTHSQNTFISLGMLLYCVKLLCVGFLEEDRGPVVERVVSHSCQSTYKY